MLCAADTNPQKKFTQSEIAKTIRKTQGYVSQVLAKISNVFEEDNINDGERIGAEQYAEKLWREFARTGKCEQYYDVFMDYLIEAERRQQIYKTVKRKFLTRFQKEAIRQAKRKNIPVDETLKSSQEKYHQERLKPLQKYRREKN